MRAEGNEEDNESDLGVPDLNKSHGIGLYDEILFSSYIEVVIQVKPVISKDAEKGKDCHRNESHEETRRDDAVGGKQKVRKEAAL